MPKSLKGWGWVTVLATVTATYEEFAWVRLDAARWPRFASLSICLLYCFRILQQPTETTNTQQ